MSLTFSRRSFLKYTAVAAVAVAGSSLLTGCKDNPYQPTGTIGDKLSIMGDFTLLSNPAPKYENGKMTCTLVIECTSKRNLQVTPYCFQVDVYDNEKDEKLLNTYRYDSAKQSVDLQNPTGDLKKDQKVQTELYCKDMNLANGNIVKIKYWPRAQASEGLLGYTEAYATWTMKYDAAKRAFVKV